MQSSVMRTEICRYIQVHYEIAPLVVIVIVIVVGFVLITNKLTSLYPNTRC